LQRAWTRLDQAAALFGLVWVALIAAFSWALTAAVWPEVEPFPLKAFSRPPRPLPAPTPNSTRPPPRMMARPRYTACTGRRRPRLRRSNSMATWLGRWIEAVAEGALGLGVGLRGGTRGGAAISDLEHDDTGQEEDYQRQRFQSGGDRIRPGHRRCDNGDDDRSVAPVFRQGASVYYAQPVQGEQHEGHLEGQPDREHRDDLERVVLLRLDEDVELVVVVALEEVDGRR